MNAASINFWTMTIQRRRINWIIAIGSPIAVFLLYTVYWFVAAEQLKVATVLWQQEQRAAGIHIDHQGLRIDGFPGTFRVAVDAPRIEWRTAMLSWSWASQRLVARTGPWSFDAVRGELVGDHNLVIGNPTTSVSYMTAADSTTFSLNTTDQQRRARLSLRGAMIDSDQLPGPLSVKEGDLVIMIGQGNGELIVDIDASGVRPPPSALRLPQAIDRVNLRAIWTGTIPHTLSHAALSEWRDNGGAIEFPRAFLKSGEVSLSAEGTLALDEEMRPVAAFKAQVRGFEAALQILTEAQDLSPTQSAALRIALRLMAKRGGQPGSVEFPLTLQGGRAYVGKLPVAQLKPLIRQPSER
jgi:hypothetical protein